MVATVVLVIVIAVLFVLALRRAYRTFTGKTSCCGGGEAAAKVKRVRVEDTDEANYPYAQDVRIGGMTCEHCADAVENAINGLGGVWARVSLEKNEAHILSKEPLDLDRVKDAVTDAGYYLARGK